MNDDEFLRKALPALYQMMNEGECDHIRPSFSGKTAYF
jgi:hypothetical protein